MGRRRRRRRRGRINRRESDSGQPNASRHCPGLFAFLPLFLSLSHSPVLSLVLLPDRCPLRSSSSPPRPSSPSVVRGRSCCCCYGVALFAYALNITVQLGLRGSQRRHRRHRHRRRRRVFPFSALLSEGTGRRTGGPSREAETQPVVSRLQSPLCRPDASIRRDRRRGPRASNIEGRRRLVSVTLSLLRS